MNAVGIAPPIKLHPPPTTPQDLNVQHNDITSRRAEIPAIAASQEEASVLIPFVTNGHAHGGHDLTPTLTTAISSTTHVDNPPSTLNDQLLQTLEADDLSVEPLPSRTDPLPAIEDSAIRKNLRDNCRASKSLALRIKNQLFPRIVLYSVHFPRLLTSTLTEDFPPLASRSERRVIRLANIIRQIAGRIKFSLTEAIAQPLKSITSISYVPIVRPKFHQRFLIMKRATGPHMRCTIIDTVILVAWSTTLGPYCALHEWFCVRHEIFNGLGLGGERFDVFRLISIEQLEHMISLGLCIHDC